MVDYQSIDKYIDLEVELVDNW